MLLLLFFALFAKALVVYHLVRKTSWSKVAVNETHQNPEKGLGRIQTENPETSSKNKWNVHFPFGKLEILDYLSANPGNFPLRKTKYLFPFTFQLKFPDCFREMVNNP